MTFDARPSRARGRWRRLCLANARSSMTAPMKFDKSVTSPWAAPSVIDARSRLDLRHRTARHVGARGGGALLALVLERTADHRRAQHVRVGRGVGQDEVLATGLADQPRVGRGSSAGSAPTCCHRCWNVGVEPVKWMPARSRSASATSRDVEAVTGHHVDDARAACRPPRAAPWSAGRRPCWVGRRLPHDRVAHQRRRGRQVAGDRGEVERRDRVDEALERAVVGAVPDAPGVQRRLLAEDLPGEVRR